MSVAKDFFVHKFGRDADVDAAGDINDNGALEFPTVAFATEILGLANDDVTSNGAHSVGIHGLDINGLEITEVVTLTGVTPVALANSYYRINRMHVKAVGALGVNSGSITARHVGSATLSQISGLEGQTLQTYFTVPAAVNGTITSWGANVSRVAGKIDATASVRLQTRKPGESWRTRDAGEVANAQNFHHQFDESRNPAHPHQPVPVGPLDDVRIRTTAVNTNNLAIAAGFEIVGTRMV